MTWCHDVVEADRVAATLTSSWEHQCSGERAGDDGLADALMTPGAHRSSYQIVGRPTLDAHRHVTVPVQCHDALVEP